MTVITSILMVAHTAVGGGRTSRQPLPWWPHGLPSSQAPVAQVYIEPFTYSSTAMPTSTGGRPPIALAPCVKPQIWLKMNRCCMSPFCLCVGGGDRTRSCCRMKYNTMDTHLTSTLQTEGTRGVN